MRRVTHLVVVLTLLIAAPAGARAQGPAAFADGRTAYEAGQFVQARDLLLSAARTASRNAEVFLWLGKAHYQLGELPEAIAAWQRTLRLAPGEPHAKKMLQQLRAEVTDVDVGIKLLEQALQEELFAWVRSRVDQLLADKTLTEAQRGKLLVLKAEAMLESGKPQDVPAIVLEVRAKHPKAAPETTLSLLRARAKVRTGGPALTEGLAALKELAEQKADADAAAIAQFELLRFALGQAAAPGPVAELAAWREAHPNHRLATTALELLLDAQLALTRQGPRPTETSELAATDVAAIASVQALRALRPQAKDRMKLLQLVDSHLTAHYDAAGAYAAAIQAGEALLKLDLSRAERVVVTRRILDRHLAASRRQPRPERDAKFSPSDRAVLARAKELLGLLPGETDGGKLAQQLLTHFSSRYAKAGSLAAAEEGIQGVLQLPLPPASRLAARRALASTKTEIALRDLTRQAAAGKLPAPMPPAVREVLALYVTIEKENVGTNTWAERTDLARKVDSLAAKLPPVAKVTSMSAPHAWAVEIALGVIQADKEGKASASAVALVDAIRTHYAKLPAPEGLRLAGDLIARLAAALPTRHPKWAQYQLARVQAMGQWAQWQFGENVRTGNAGRNAQLGDTQKEMIGVLADVVARDVRGQAASAVKTLQVHLQLWEGHRHYAAVEAGYELLVAALPEAHRREVRLAVAEMWIAQGRAAHQRMQAVGLEVSVPLDATFVKALKRCYDLQAGLAEGDAFGAKVRGVAQRVVGHYTALGYHDTAAAAIAVKGDKPVPVADRYAQLARADHQYAQAQRELARLLRQYSAEARLGMTPAFQAALKAYREFITQHPASVLTTTAVRSVFSIAQTFESHGAHDVAAGVYDGFAKFAAKIPTLSHAQPGQAGTAERAALAHAAALDAHARAALAKALAARKDKTPPAKVLPEFTAALGAYKQFVKDRPGSVLVGEAVRRIMAVALEYAKVDGWDVAEGVFADFAGAGLKLASPERIEFARGICHLGKVMPDHARAVLTALTAGHGKPSGQTGLALVGGDDVDKKDAPEKPARTGRGGRSPSPVTTPAARPGPTPKPEAPPADVKAVLGEVTGAAEESQVRDEADALTIAAIRQQQNSRARQIAALREKLNYSLASRSDTRKTQQGAQKGGKQTAPLPPPVLSDAELARQQQAFEAAYALFQAVRKAHPLRPTAEQARGEVLVMVGHWRTVAQWKRAAGLAEQYLKDNPTDRELPKLRLAAARDILAWASQPAKEEGTKRERLTQVLERFAQAREALGRIVAGFPKDRPLIQQAQWDIANSFLTQARVVDGFSPTLARGQYVRSAKELLAVAERFHDHPKIASIPQMLWSIADELGRRRYFEEAVLVWNELRIHFVTHALALQAATRIAQTFESSLGRPLRAAEAYAEINFARGGSDKASQDAVYNIGVRLKAQKRWVEALHVLETFVDSFPRHPNAGQALTTVGQIHQVNEAWEDAIAAYQRVMEEFPTGNWIREAKWAIAECRINLSQWHEAMVAYEDYLKVYAKDPRAAEARRRVGVAKDLARYQALVDEKGQRKAFDAQFQIARIVQDQLSNPPKAIIEYRKVATNWPKTHLADDALFTVGNIYLTLGEIAKGREALSAVAEQYPDSPLADDALLRIGQSHESEAQQLAGVTREGSLEKNKDLAQREAYRQVQAGRRRLQMDNDAVVAAFRAQGKKQMAEVAQARGAANFLQFQLANTTVAAQAAEQQVETLTASQMADRQDKINAALRKAVSVYQRAAKVPAADKADEALLQMAQIYDAKLKDAEAAMATWQEIVRQFSGTAVAEDASWRIAEYHERKREYAAAITAYQAFLRNYRRSSRAAAAQFAVAENYEHLGEWVKAMDAYTNYINNFPKAPLAGKAREQISWIKTYRL